MIKPLYLAVVQIMCFKCINPSLRLCIIHIRYVAIEGLSLDGVLERKQKPLTGLVRSRARTGKRKPCQISKVLVTPPSPSGLSLSSEITITRNGLNIDQDNLNKEFITCSQWKDVPRGLLVTEYLCDDEWTVNGSRKWEQVHTHVDKYSNPFVSWFKKHQMDESFCEECWTEKEINESVIWERATGSKQVIQQHFGILVLQIGINNHSLELWGNSPFQFKQQKFAMKMHHTQHASTSIHISILNENAIDRSWNIYFQYTFIHPKNCFNK